MPTVEEQTKQELVDQLVWDDRVDASDVEVTVENGTVVLAGTVPHQHAYQAAEEDALATQGVRQVVNLLQRTPSGEPVPTDDEIEDTVTRFLILNAELAAADIQVTVTDGLVTLDGTVDAYWKKDLAARVARQVTGVIDVVEVLSVVPTVELSDKAIAWDLVAALRRSPVVDAERVDVVVENGEVTLEGSVPSWLAYGAVHDAAQFTAGVIDVDNRLRIE